MDISNASLYDGGSAVSEAVLMAMTVTRRLGRVVVAGSIHPEYIQILRTNLANLEPEIVVVPPRDGQVQAADLAQARSPMTPLPWSSPIPTFSASSKMSIGLVKVAKAGGALSIVSVDPISLGLLRRPGDYGADIVVAEGQCLGNALAYGGPYLGILACREAFVRKMPGRVVGSDGRPPRQAVLRLTLQTREQHIRREKATSNICTNQGLLALRASIYLSAVGPGGLRKVAELSTRKAHYAAEQLAEIAGLTLAFPGPFFKEFVVRSTKDPAAVLAKVGQLGYHGGINLGQWYPEMADSILIAVTEKRTKAEIDGLVAAYRKALELA